MVDRVLRRLWAVVFAPDLVCIVLPASIGAFFVANYFVLHWV